LNDEKVKLTLSANSRPRPRRETISPSGKGFGVFWITGQRIIARLSKTFFCRCERGFDWL